MSDYPTQTAEQTPIEKLRRFTFSKIARLSDVRTEAEAEEFVGRTIKDWRHALPVDRDRAIVAYFKNPAVHLPENLRDVAIKGSDLMRERAAQLQEIIALIYGLRQAQLAATNSNVPANLSPLEREKRRIEDLTRDTVRWVMDLSGQPEDRVRGFVTRFMHTPDYRMRKEACLELCPPGPPRQVDDWRRRYIHPNDRNQATMVTGLAGPLKREPQPIPIKLPGFTQEQAKAGRAFELLNHLRSEKSRYRDQVLRHEREMKLAQAKLERLAGGNNDQRSAA